MKLADDYAMITLSINKLYRFFKRDKHRKRHALVRRIVLTVNLALVIVFGAFIAWDSYEEWHGQIKEKKNAMEEEARILVRSVIRLKNRNELVQNFIDEVCESMQETTSPGHHIAVQLGSEILQAKTHRRSSSAMFKAMQNAVNNPDSIASSENGSIVVGTASLEDVTIYVSEYLSNIKQIVIAQITRRIISIIFVGFTLAVVLNIIVQRIIASPLHQMVEVIRRFATGQRDKRMPNVTTKELGILGDEFNNMASIIETAEKDRNNRLQKARQIQQNLLPKPSHLKDLRLSFFFSPASEVAGDYYDVIRMQDNSLLFCIADVIGHDVPAAMNAAMVKTLLKEAVTRENDLSKLIYRVHSALVEVTLENDFVTMILARWSEQDGYLYYVNAGHETGYLMRSNGQIEELNSTGPVLGLESLSGWTERKMSIGKGERLLLLTDGVTETLSPNGEAFGRKRVIGIIEKSRQETVEGVLQKLSNSVIGFRGSGRQLDDITMLAVDL
jgi:serine phosphatase RsbU (regulator of sigma subunit)/predicted PurR-regulated permease PerM